MTTPPHDWDSSYLADEPPPWDIGRPQPAFVTLADRGKLSGEVLDAGCGTGEHTLLAASSGADATGVDLSEAAIRAARVKAAQRGLSAHFEVGDVAAMSRPRGGFDVAIDSGLFHVFGDDERADYVAALSRLVRPGGTCHLMCFSDRQPGDWGPRRVRQIEIEEAFSRGWTVESIQAAEFEINPIFDITTASAWLAEIRRTPTADPSGQADRI